LKGRETICLDDDESTPCTKQAKLEEKSDAKVIKVEYIADKLKTIHKEEYNRIQIVDRSNSLWKAQK